MSNPSAKSRFAPTVGQIEAHDIAHEMLDYSGSSGRNKRKLQASIEIQNFTEQLEVL